MKTALILFAAFSLFLFGCLQIDSNKPTPTPIIIYVNASPQVTVVVTEKAIPTVTEKVVYSSPTIIPANVPKGGIEDLGIRTDFITLDLSKFANADYHHPFSMKTTTGPTLFKSLKPMEIDWNGIPFKILPEYSPPEGWNAITTNDPNFFSASIISDRVRMSKVFFLLSGNFPIGTNRQLGLIRVNYMDGDTQDQNINSNENVWNYVDDANNPTPQDRIAWKSADGSEKLTWQGINVTRPLEPVGGFTIKKVSSGESGFTIFAATGMENYRVKKLTHTQTEFQQDEYNRIYTTTLTAGAMINYDDSTGVRVYRSEGTFESPIFDGETDLANWKLLEYDAVIDPSTSLKIQVRTGKDPQLDTTWTNWQDVANKSPIPKTGRYLQWKAVMKTTDTSKTPLLTKLSLTYENPE